MAQLNNEDVKKIAKMACIELDENSCEYFKNQLNDTISWIEKLSQVDTSKIEPILNVHGINLRLETDEIKDGNITQDVLKNTQNAKYNYFCVPKVIE